MVGISLVIQMESNSQFDSFPTFNVDNAASDDVNCTTSNNGVASSS